jgi:hypothetical protein
MNLDGSSLPRTAELARKTTHNILVGASCPNCGALLILPGEQVRPRI